MVMRWPPLEMETLIRSMNRVSRQRTTLYGDAHDDRYRASLNAAELKLTSTGAGTSDLDPRKPKTLDFEHAATL
jgi:hypothetical protein